MDREGIRRTRRGHAAGPLRAGCVVIRVLVSGTLYGAPVQRTGQNGKPFVTAKLRVDTGEEGSAWASVIAFGAEAERLAGLKDGDALSVAGRATVQGYIAKDGNAKASLSIVADEVAAVRRKPRPAGDEGGGARRGGAPGAAEEWVGQA
jgi:single-stranded DNA-binding protein